jgi:hypothetical protein
MNLGGAFMKSTYLVLFSFFVINILGCSESANSPRLNDHQSTEDLSHKTHDHQELEDLTVNSQIGQLAVTPNEVEKSVCQSSLPSSREINDYYFNQSNKAPVEDIYFNYVMAQTEFGSTETEISFMAQNRAIYSLLEGVLFNVKSIKVENNKLNKVFSISNSKPVYDLIRSYCRDVQCAAESVFGDSWGLRLLFKERYGVVLSGHVDPGTIDFQDEEFVRSAAFAVLSLPKGTFPLNKENYSEETRDIAAHNLIIAPYADGKGPVANLQGAAGVTTSSRSSGGENGTSLVTNTDIYLLDPWKEMRDHHARAYVVFHELIHVMDQAKAKGKVLSVSPGWLKLSKWSFDEVTGQWTMGSPKTACSEYGSSQPAEDFAECGSMYRYAPAKLKKISKSKYAFFKKHVFKNVEYLKASNCKKAIEVF